MVKEVVPGIGFRGTVNNNAVSKLGFSSGAVVDDEPSFQELVDQDESPGSTGSYNSQYSQSQSPVSARTRSASSIGSQDSESNFLVVRYRKATLAFLLIIFISNQASRALPCYLVNFGEHALPEKAINKELDFGPQMYGFFATLAFTIPFTLASLGAGLLADRSNRLVASCVAGLAWSAVTMLMAVSTSFAGLVATRMLLGLAQAATMPCGLSLIADLFPETRATMSSVFTLGIYIGGGVASLAIALNQEVGWRRTCAIFGAGGMFVSCSLLWCKDPKHEVRAAEEFRTRTRVFSTLGRAFASTPEAFGEVVDRTQEALATRPAKLLLLASTMRFCIGFAIIVWLPSAMKLRFPNDMGRFALFNSVIKAAAGGISSLAGGLTTDLMRARGFGDHAGAFFCAVVSALAAPLFWMTFASNISFEASMTFLLLQYLFAESWLGPAVSTLHSSVAPERRGTAQGVFSSLTALGNALPTALGLLPVEQLVIGLQASVVSLYVLSALCFGIAAVLIRSAAEQEPSSEDDAQEMLRELGDGI